MPAMKMLTNRSKLNTSSFLDAENTRISKASEDEGTNNEKVYAVGCDAKLHRFKLVIT